MAATSPVAPVLLGARSDHGSKSSEKSHDRGTEQIQVFERIPRFCFKVLLYSPLIAVTASRLTANVATVMDPNSIGRKFFYGDHWPIPLQVLDSLARPLVGALSFVPFSFRFNWQLLPSVSLIGCIATEFFSCLWELYVIMATSEADGQWVFDFRGGGLVLGCWASRLSVTAVSQMKLEALGWERLGLVCFWTWPMWLLFHSLLSALELRRTWVLILSYACQGLLAAVQASVLLYEAHMKQRLLNKKMSNKFVNTASRVVWFLRLGAFLTLADAIYLPLAENFGNKLGLSPGVFLTLDNSMVLATLLVLGGLVGPRDTLDQGKLLEELEHMGRTQGKRIAFPGRVNYDSQHCIVSFPGKYSEEWDAAVRMVEVRSSACSLACVFLTDPDSGLGVHEDNPEEPGNCWCKALYGQVPAATYITIVEDPMALSAEDLRFKESDAAAMGQIFLKREGQSDEQWAEAKEAAQTAARAKCEENRGRAPWGCRWFHDWKRNVDEAVARGQTLHVFYFEGRVGCGKLPWQELSNETSVKKARENGGLGASQTAEVAYLERCGCAFQEHDVKVFYRFMEEHKTNI